MINVDGFLFEDEEVGELAKKEDEGVHFIKERTALNNPEVVFKLYKKLIEQELFVTPVGQRFMVELQNILLSSNYIARADIPPIKVAKYEPPEEEPKQPVKKVAKKIDKKVGGEYQKPFYIALFFAIIFGVSIIGMFIINEISSNSVSIINYREEILNEYSSWEAELKEKEAELKAREKALEEREATANDVVIEEATHSPFLPLEENGVNEEAVIDAESEDNTTYIETNDDTTYVIEP